MNDRDTIEAALLPKAHVVDWLVKKAREYRAAGETVQADTAATLASKVARGAVRPDNLLMLPANFFEPGRTYARRVTAGLAEFRVARIATHPDGYSVAFGWYRRRPRTSWHPYSCDDYFSGWAEVTEDGDA